MSDPLAWRVRAPSAGDDAPATPQQRRLAALEAAGSPLRGARLVARIEAPVDEAGLRARVETVLGSHPALAGAEASLRLRDGDGAVLALETPPGRVDAAALARLLAQVAGREVEPGASLAPAALVAYFDDLLRGEDGAAARRAWDDATAERCSAAELSTALGRRARTSSETRAFALRTRVGPAPADEGWEAVLLAAWRLTLARLAPRERGCLGVYRDGPADELPGAVALLGRYVPVGIGRAEPPDAATALQDAAAELERAAAEADFFDPGRLGGMPYCAGFRQVRLPEHASGWVADVLDAPIDRCAVELHALEGSRGLHAAVHVDPAAIDVRLGPLLTSWLETLLERLPDLARAAATIPRLLPAAGARGPRREIAPDVGRLVEEQAARAPAAVAARDDRDQLTYEELLGAAAGIASELAAHGVEAGHPVAVAMERRVLLPAAVLGVLRLGAHFVPLDTAHPPRRLAAVVADAGAKVVVADASAAVLLAGLPAAVVRADAASARHPVDAARGPVELATTAYVLYTSGSTGTPKGVEVTHGALANYLQWALEAYDVAGGHGSLVHSSIAVDLTLTSLLAPLLAGRTVVLVPSDEPEALAAGIVASRDLSFLKLTPSGLALQATLLPPAALARATRHLVLGGEQLTRRVLTGLHGCDGLVVTNEYGPTETTVGSTAYTFRAGEAAPDPIPVGVPIWNTGVEIVDPDGTPCPPGIVGEIVLSGAGVARGYRNRPQETRSRFTFGPDGAPRYRTGDFGRMWPGGPVECHGRRDDQAKVHGFRVEVGEVEAVLAAAEGVVAAAVVPVTRPGHDDTFLSAFVVGAGAGAPQLEQRLHAVAAAELPAHARPDRIELVDALPLTSAGKADRQRLVARSLEPLRDRSTAAPSPEDAVASVVAACRRVLGRDGLGPSDGFFASGGDSIRALHLVAEVRRRGYDLSVRDVMHARTLGSLAAAAVPREGTGAAGAGGGARSLPVTPAQEAFLARHGSAPAGWTLRWLFPAPEEGVDAELLDAAFRSVVRRHPALRTRFSLEGGEWRASVADPEEAVAHLRADDWSDLPPAQLEPSLARIAVELDPRAAERGPQAAPPVRLVRLPSPAAGPRWLAWLAHHLLVDAVSLEIMARDLWDACASPNVDPPEDLAYDEWAGRVAASFPPAAPVAAAAGSASGRQLAQALTGIGPGAAAPTRGLEALALLVAAMARTLDAELELPRPSLCVELLGRPRDDLGLELADTVGWLTTFHSLALEPGEPADVPHLVEAVRERTLTAALADPRRLPPIAVNFLGEIAEAPLPQFLDARAQRTGPLLFDLELVAWSQGADLRACWRFDPAAFELGDVERVARRFAHELAQLGPHARASASRTAGYADRSLTEEDLDRILEAF